MSSGKQLPGYPVHFDGRLLTPVQVGQRTIFQYANKEALFAIKLISGEKLWSMPTGRYVVAVNKDNVYVIDSKKRLNIVSQVLGTKKARVTLPTISHFAHNVLSDLIYASDIRGHMHCFEPKSEK